MSKKNNIDISEYQDKKLIAFDLYGTCIHRPEGIFGKGFSISKELKKTLETNPIDMNQIENGDLIINGVEVKLPKKVISKVKKDIAGILVYPDFKDIIDYLKSKGYQTAVVSNLAKPYEEPLRKLISEGTFDYEALSFDVGAIKPNPKIFEYLKNQTGIDYDKIVFIGDSLASDVLGPANIGIKPIHINRRHKGSIENQEKHGINYIQISTLNQLKNIL